MIFLDSILTKEEKESITEIYWACRFGKNLTFLLDNNPSYPNLKIQHTISDKIGKETMKQFEPNSLDFWHFRPDHRANFLAALQLFEIENENLWVVDSMAMFNDSSRLYQGCSFIENSIKIDDDFILFHYPTSTRPRNDIASISNSDWHFVNQLSLIQKMKIIVVSDCDIKAPLDNYELLINPDINYIVNLSASCNYFAGCDSFIAHLACKTLDKEKLFIKSHDQNIKNKILTSLHGRHFYPHSAEDVAYFYRPYIGY